MASRKNDIKVNIEAEVKDFTDAMNSVHESIGSIKKEFNNFNAVLKDSSNTVDVLKRHKQSLRKEIEDTNLDIKSMKQHLKDLNSVQGMTSSEIEKTKQELVEAKKQYEEAGNRVKELQEKLKSLNKNQEENKDEIKKTKEELKLAKEEYKNAGTAMKDTESKLEDLNNKQDQNTKEMQKAEKELIKAETHYSDLKNKLKEVTEQLDKQTISLKSLSEGFGKVSETANKFANSVKWLSAGAGSLLGISAKTAIELEDAFVGVEKTVNGTDNQLQQIKKDIMAMGRVIPTSQKELFKLAETAGQLGIETDSVAEFTRLMAMLGTATNMSANEAGEALATFYNVMGTLPENYEKVANVVVKLGNNAKATESDIVSMAQRMSGAASNLGMSESAVLGLATAISSVGIEAEMGGTAISRIMNDFNRAASGVETKYGTLAQYAEIAGMSTDKFAKALRENAGYAVQEFIVGLGDTNRTGKNTIQLLSELGISEVRLSDTMQRLSSASDGVRKYMGMANEEWENGNALTAEATRKYADTASQIQLAKNKLSELANTFGQHLLPYINEGLDKLGKLAEWFGNLDEETQKNILKTLAFTAALAPLAKIVGSVAGGLKNFFAALDGIKKSETAIALLGGLKNVFSGIGTVISGLGAKIAGAFEAIATALGLTCPELLLIVAIIAAVIGAIVLLWNKCEWFRNLITGLFEKIKSVVVTVWEFIKNTIINTWNTIVKVTKPIFETIANLISTAWEKIKEIWEPVKQFFVDTWNYIIETLGPVKDSLFNMFNEAWLLIQTIWELAGPFFQTLWDTIQVIFSTVASTISGVFIAAWNFIKPVWDTVSPYFTMIWNNIQAVFSVVATVLGGFFSVAWAAIKTVWDAVTGYFKAIFDTIAAIFSVIRNVLTGNFKDAWDGIKGIVNTWGEYFQSIWNNIKNIFSKVIDFFRNTFSSAWNAIKSIFSNVGSFFGGIWDTIKSVFVGIAQTVSDAMTSVFKAAVNGLLGAAEKVLNLPISAINTAIDILNLIPGVDIGKLSKFTLPRMAKGTVLEDGARAVIAGEDGAEAIVPLERNTKWINRVAEQFKTAIFNEMPRNYINPEYVERTNDTSLIINYIETTNDLLERILDKPSDFYVDSRKLSESTANSDDVASGDLLEKYERGWAL